MTAEIQDDGIGRRCLGECPAHRRAYLLDGNIRINEAIHLRLSVLIENASDSLGIIRTYPKVVLSTRVVSDAHANNIGSCWQYGYCQQEDNEK